MWSTPSGVASGNAVTTTNAGIYTCRAINDVLQRFTTVVAENSGIGSVTVSLLGKQRIYNAMHVFALIHISVNCLKRS